MAKEWAKKFYNSTAWKECRAAYIKSVQGLCETCLERDEVKPGFHSASQDTANASEY